MAPNSAFAKATSSLDGDAHISENSRWRRWMEFAQHMRWLCVPSRTWFYRTFLPFLMMSDKFINRAVEIFSWFAFSDY